MIEPPSLVGRRARLRIIRPNDYPFLYELALDPVAGFRWRYRSSHPGFEEFCQTFRQGVLLNFLIESPERQRQLGYIACYRHDFRNRHAYLAVLGHESVQGQSVMMEAVQLFVDYVFACYDFRKIYVECPGFTLDSIRSCLDHVFVEEGHFHAHERYLGEWWDLHVLSTDVEAWRSWRGEVQGRRNIEREQSDRQFGDEPLDEARFLEYLRTEIEDPRVTSLDLNLVDDLNLDSIGMFMLVGAVEDLGVELRDHELSTVKTLSDVYFLYLQAR